MTYTPTISLNYSSFDIDEGATRTITATTHPSGLTVSWHTSDSTAATVSGGIVTGVAAKTTAVTISASVTVDGTTYTTTCQVYVTISDGVYYLKNQNSNYYLHVKDGNINNYTDVVQFPLYGSSYINAYRIRQLWKIKYIGSGKYSVRPMHKLNMGLDVDDGNVDIYTIGTTDSLSGIINNARWSIGRYSNSSSGLIFQNNGTASKTMQVSGASNTIEASVIAGNYSSISLNCRWMPTLVSSPPTGVIIYDTSTGLYVNPAIRYVSPGETRSLYSFNLTAAFYSGTAITQTVTWSSSDTSVATVNSSTGNVTGVSPGWTVIYASRLVGGTTYSASYDVYVTEIANGTYFLKSKDTSRYVDIEDQNMANGTNIHQWDFHGGDSQCWIFTHLGDGYYSIKSANSTSNYYLGVLNDGTATDTQVVLRTGSLTDGMKWKVSVTTSGAYKITPKTGEPNDRVLAVGWYAFNVNGIDIKQRDYVDDGNYKDEWYMFKIDGKDVLFVAITDTDGRDRVTEFNYIFSYLNDYGYDDFNFIYTDYISASDCLSNMEDASIFVSRSHGGYDADKTWIRLFKDGTASRLYSTNIYNSSTLVNFSSMDIAIFAACYTAKNTDSGKNLADASVNAGANYSIGFNDSIGCTDANNWVKYFFYYHYAKGYSIEYSCTKATNDVSGLTGKYYIAH